MTHKLFCKSHFDIPKGVSYFSGHSLGPITQFAKQHLAKAINAWEHTQVNAWHQTDWLALAQDCGDKIAPLIGASMGEVIVCDNTTLNLLKLLLMALSLNPGRKIILTEQGNFPTDNYIAQSVANLKDVEFVALPKEDIIEALNDEVAVLLLTQVDYKTAQKWDMAALTKLAHQKGILTLWDLSHSVGVIELKCSKHQVDFAVGCTYKYLNGGPGAPGFIYVNEKHLPHPNAIQGWMGHLSPFDFSPHFSQGEGIKRYLSGTPSILSMKALQGALRVYEQIEIAQVDYKSQCLSQSLIEESKQFPGLTCISPLEADKRGSHVAFSHPKALLLCEVLKAKGIIVDHRKPDIIRFGISPLYLNEEDIDLAIKALKHAYSVPNILSPASPNPGQI